MMYKIKMVTQKDHMHDIGKVYKTNEKIYNLE